MPNAPHKFKNRDITRCLKAASAAGVSHPTVEVHLLPGGTTKYVVGGEVVSASKKSGAAGGKKKPASPIGGAAFPAIGGQTGTGRKR